MLMMRAKSYVPIGLFREVGNLLEWTDTLGGTYATDSLPWAPNEPQNNQLEIVCLFSERILFHDTFTSLDMIDFFPAGGSVFCI